MLTLPRLVARNLRFHWRGNVAVLLGVAVGSAVLTGALLVGDSLRGSLRAKAERQLAGVQAAAFFPRPVRAAVSPAEAAPALVLPGSLQLGDDGYLGRVTVYGVDRSFGRGVFAAVDWNATFKRGTAPVVLPHRVADRLGAKVGDRITIGVQRFSDLPRASSLAKRGADDVAAADGYVVAAVLPPEAQAGDFSLSPTPAAPLNVFVPIAALSDQARDETDRSAAPLATALFGWGRADTLTDALKANLTPADHGVRLRVSRKERYLSVESDQLVLPAAQVDATRAAAADLKRRAEPTVVYVADTLAGGGKELPYPVVAGLNASAAAPLGPFLPKGVAELKDDEVVLPEWPENPFRGLAPGTPLTLTYYHPDIEGEGKVLTAALTFRGFIPLAGAANDRDLTPAVRGVTDERANLFDWDRPPMLPKARIRERVPDNGPRAKFWNAYRATPMAYVNLATAERLFAGRFGTVTSVRVAPAEGETAEQLADRFGPALLTRLDPAASGMAFQPVRDRLLAASRGGTDFGGLFLGFSFFLIAAALMLVGLLFRLSLDRRAKEIGLLLAAGFAVKHVRRLVLAEGLLLAVVGAAVGLGAAVAYNRLLLALLIRLWPDPEVGTFLEPHAAPLSFGVGFGLTVLMAVGALWLSVRGLVRVAPPALLRGETTVAVAGPPKPPRLARWLLLGVPVGVVLIAAGSWVGNPDYRAMTFFGGGGLLLTAALAGVWLWMKRTRHAEVNGRGLAALARLGSRNAARNPGRSLLTAALLAAAAFLLVAVESFRRDTGKDFAAVGGGSGGFNLLAEVDVPVYDPVRAPGAEVVPLRLKGGDDASCMNLYQATRPRVLGVPESLVTRGGFHFYQTEADTPEERDNPWLLLNRTYPDGSVPVFAENNTAVWMLHVMVGGTVTLPDDAGNDVKLRLVGTLTDSPFQSELLMADGRFLKLFPQQDGSRVFLVHADAERDATRALQAALRPNGVVVTPTREKVAAYQAVVGAYLSTFQLLGGFGLLLGVLGLAVVLLRGVWERVGELALLRAVGYRPRALQVLVLSENAFLLLLGLAAGVLAALASVAPHVAGGASVPWGRLALMLGGVLVAGFSVAAAATAGILRVPVVPALRRE
ncbi:FtsX-like permease family protein [Urbifossiella limnaea]|uniref:FtsX-like permease family protein n=1 Tax=Urbifossiella limnaea TaxID=2528023 RepID=A0A517XXS9_9BACT|nr:FtsX-like permease family protein [Urbifossiella limnaea]QDU22283.1 FtsX-like permease family protein [Urbifossiella limnaea]